MKSIELHKLFHESTNLHEADDDDLLGYGEETDEPITDVYDGELTGTPTGKYRLHPSEIDYAADTRELEDWDALDDPDAYETDYPITLKNEQAAAGPDLAKQDYTELVNKSADTDIRNGAGGFLMAGNWDEGNVKHDRDFYDVDLKESALNETRHNTENERFDLGKIKECIRDVLQSDFGLTIRRLECSPTNGQGPDTLIEIGLDGSKYDDDIIATVYRRYVETEPETTIFLGSVLAGEGSYWESHTVEEFEHDLTDIIKTAQVAGNIKGGKVVLSESSDIVRKKLEAAVAAAKDMEPLKEFKVSHNILAGEGELTTVLRDLNFVGEIEKELGKGEWTVWFRDNEAYLDLKVNYSTGKYRFELFNMASSEGKWAGVSIEEFVHDVKEAHDSI